MNPSSKMLNINGREKLLLLSTSILIKPKLPMLTYINLSLIFMLESQPHLKTSPNIKATIGANIMKRIYQTRFIIQNSNPIKIGKLSVLIAMPNHAMIVYVHMFKTLVLKNIYKKNLNQKLKYLQSGKEDSNQLALLMSYTMIG